MPRERRREPIHNRTTIPEFLGDVEDRISHDGEILAAVNTPMHHLLLYEPELLDRANTRPSVAKRRKDSRHPWTAVDEPGTDSGLRHGERTIIR